MAVGKRPAAAVLDAGHQATDHCKRRRRVRIGSAADFEFEDTPWLGEGSFGAVRKARHRVTGKTIAIKFLGSTSTSTDDPAGVNNDNEIMCEARFLEACGGNPYVVASHGLLRYPDTLKLCLAMDYVGPNLQAFLSKRPPLPEANVKAFMWQLLTGAKEMHERKIVHRDIKPANILVGQEGKILKICDLGLAMSLETEKMPSEYAGTVPYMAPEMLLGKPNYDARVDTWPLGCVMAEMLTGKALFKRDDAMAQLWAIFRVLGLPDETTWPEFESLPLAASVSRLFLEQRSTLGNFFPQEMLSQDGYQVLKGLLECNPDKRLTAAAALQLPWFAPPQLHTDHDHEPRKNLVPLRIKITPTPTPTPTATTKKKNLLRIKIIPPATPKPKKKIMPRIKIIPPATPRTKKNLQRIKVIPPATATPQMKNVLRIPLAMWIKAT